MTRSKRLRRIVLDTNLVLSALVFSHGRLATLRQAWQARRFQPLASNATVSELIRVLSCPKFKLTADEQQDLLADYLPWCTSVRIPEPPPVTPDCRDPKDVMFLHLALAGKAECLVSGDQDLLALGDQFPCLILTADEFLQSIGD